ncbi:class I SAM-dependent methyltransferase [soil metagenome]
MNDPETDIRKSYDAVAKDYADEFADDLAQKILDRALLNAFAETVRRYDGDATQVADLGCGPGYEADLLATLGLDVIGLDLSPATIAEAQRRHAARHRLEFRVGSLLSLPFADATLAGAIALYAVIHLDRDRRTQAYREMARVVCPGGTLLISVHTSGPDHPGGSVRRMTQWLGQAVTLDGHFIAIEEVVAGLTDAGFTVDARLERGPSTPREFPSQRLYVLATRR